MSYWHTKPQGGWTFSSDTLYNTSGSTNSLFYAGDDKTFFTNKTYLFKSRIKSLSTLQSDGIYITTPWNDTFRNISLTSLSTDDGYINFYSTPSFRVDSSNNPDIFTGITFSGGEVIKNYSYLSYADLDNKFGPTSGIYDIEIKELDWKIHGYSWIESIGLTSGTLLGNTNKGKGWSYNSYEDTEFFEWFDSAGGANPAGDTFTSSSGPISVNYREINHISRFIDYNFFNLSFTTTLSDDAGFKIYLSDSEPYTGNSTQSFNNWINNSDIIATFTASSSPTFSAFFGLKGNKFISFVADKVDSGANIRLFGLKVEGGYGEGNNRQYIVDENDFSFSDLQGVTFSSFVGIGDTYNQGNDAEVSQIFSKIGNGSFNAGMWENGVWNNGWRVDNSVREFDDIDISIKSKSDVRWRFRIIGPSASVANFNLGDEVTIGNVVAIDINERRRFIRDKYRIISINPTGVNDRIGFITVELTTKFPIRRIERDSKKHKIKVSKNGWLSGAFLNGYFTGVWNYGLFKGYPLITEMFDTNWIDGIFDGGHFKSDYYISGTFSDTIFKNNKLGLQFDNLHLLAVGDVITLSMDDKNINNDYNTETKIIEVLDDYSVVTDIDYGIKKIGALESGEFTTEIATGLIQNMVFNSNNKSKITSIDSINTQDVFIYDSWIDVNYSNTSAVNIGKSQTKINEFSRKSFSENNLYGYPTDDVLSSDSIFRDSYTLDTRNYKLGVKWKIFNDYIGDSSKFTEYFGTSSEDTQLFLDQGWTFSKYSTNSITFSRTNDEGIKDIKGEELKVEAIQKGGVLDISDPLFNINNRTLEKIERNRYTFVEFDLITYSVSPVPTFERTLIPPAYEPYINFDNVNKTRRIISKISSSFNTIPAEYLPIYRNIEHLDTPKRRKVEYFFNKRNLSMNFKGSGSSKNEYVINNLKLYEVDMIPFFQYFIDININKSIQIPYQGIAPYIDYESSDFNFLDNINIGLDSILLESTTELFTGVGVGIISGGISSFSRRDLIEFSFFQDNTGVFEQNT